MTLTLVNPADTFVYENKPTKNYVGSPVLRISNATGKRSHPLIHFAGTVTGPDALVASAHMYVYAKGTWGSAAVVAEPITGPWSSAKQTWATEPAITTTNAVTVTQAATDGTLFDFDVTTAVQVWATGKNLGFRLRTTSTTQHDFYSSQATGKSAAFKPILVIEWSKPPAAPTSLNPANNQQVSVPRPTITFKHGDPAGLAMNAYQLQTNATNVWTSPTYDSGTVSTSVQQHVLASDIADGATLYYRVRTRNTAGQWGPYCDGQQFGRTNKGTVTITAPGASPNDYVEELTPPFAATFSGAAETWQIYNSTPAAPNVYAWKSGIQTGAIGYTSAKKIARDSTGLSRVAVRVWDDVDRATTPGDPPHVTATRVFSYVPSASVTPFSSVALVPPGIIPQAAFTFSRATMPDSITVQRSDGKAWTDLDPGDHATSSTTYLWTDSTAPPEHELTYTFVAVVNGKAASTSPTSDPVTIDTNYMWILDADDPEWFIALEGEGNGTMGMGEESAVHEIRGADQVVVITEALRGYEDAVTGNLLSNLAGLSGVSAQTLRDRVWDIKADPTKVWRLVLSDINIPVVFRMVSPEPVADAELNYQFTAEAYQQGELPWDLSWS